MKRGRARLWLDSPRTGVVGNWSGYGLAQTCGWEEWVDHVEEGCDDAGFHVVWVLVTDVERCAAGCLAPMYDIRCACRNTEAIYPLRKRVD